MSKISLKRSELLASMRDEFRQFATVTILFHQAIADRLGMHVTDHKCADILLRTGPITAGELAELTGLTTGAITGVIDRLEKAGFVRRAKDPHDRRRVIIEPIRERLEQEVGPYFESIGCAMDDLCGDYSDRDLAAVRDFIARFRHIVDDQTRNLRDTAGTSTKADRHPRNRDEREVCLERDASPLSNPDSRAE